ncbi:hypothetical protein FHS83_000128 [Rhizomicrobium palustre]|uniref:Hemerythrin-like domain-containing protein n=1 Tax=Rhizomicrobium palustre TaxID=189966 RepID=A0A846MUQ6_9PROT|nr:hemerythrin domain-containing protein [Rhizomicrobium palustre]NIK86810.1 hypothetical protein [Rhizomicrobium palustre]
MLIVDKFIAAVTPMESEKDRADARAKAFAAAEPGDWLSLVLNHHLELEDALAAIEELSTPGERRDAFKEFSIFLVGHAIAEEGVIYPALAAHSEAGHANMAYSEQAAVKIEMAVLEQLDPLSEEFEDKLEAVKGALLHHMYEEESDWFLALKKNATPADQELMTNRYAEEFDRYTGDMELTDDEDEDEEDGR